MSGYKVDVSGLSRSTNKEKLNDFFTFCGKIESIELNQKAGTAVVAFEKSSAAKTALMLNGGALDGATISVTSDTAFQEDVREDAAQPLDQTHKPRAGIAAEYLAKGYALSDQILQRAIELDRERGISQKFIGYVQTIDKTAGERALGPGQTLSRKATESFQTVSTKASEGLQPVSTKATELYQTVSTKATESYQTVSTKATESFQTVSSKASESYGNVSAKASESFQGARTRAMSFDEQKGISRAFFDYLQKALASPFGQRVKEFYTTTSKQVADIREEAVRLAAQAQTRLPVNIPGLSTPAATTAAPAPVPVAPVVN